MTWLSPKQAADEMSMRAFNERYRCVVKPLGGDEEHDPDLCTVDIVSGGYITPDGERGSMHFIAREDKK